MKEKEWIEIGRVVGDTGPKGSTGDIGIGTVIKGHYDNYSQFIEVHPSGSVGDAYIINGDYYYWNGIGWANAGSLKGDVGSNGFSPIVDVDHLSRQIIITSEDGSATISFDELKGDTGKAFEFSDFTKEQLDNLKGEKGDTGDTGASLTIKGSYDSYEELINNHPYGNVNDIYLVNGFIYIWNGSLWENVGNIKGEKGDTGDVGQTGAKGDDGANAYINVNHEDGTIAIGVSGVTSDIINFSELKGDTGDTGKAFEYSDFTQEQLNGLKGEKGDVGSKGDKGDTGPASDENAGWKLPVNKILTTTELPTNVSKGYRVAICTSSVMEIKQFNGTSWDSENLDEYSVIPLKHSGSIQMYLAKSSGPKYMGVDYGIFGKFRFMTQKEYDSLSSYDEDTIYFVRS